MARLLSILNSYGYYICGFAILMVCVVVWLLARNYLLPSFFVPVRRRVILCNVLTVFNILWGLIALLFGFLLWPLDYLVSIIVILVLINGFFPARSFILISKAKETLPAECFLEILDDDYYCRKMKADPDIYFTPDIYAKFRKNLLLVRIFTGLLIITLGALIVLRMRNN